MILVDRYESNEKRPLLDSVTNIIPANEKKTTNVGFLLTAQFDFQPLAFWGPQRHPASLGLGSIVLSCHRLQVMHPECTKNYWQQVLDAQWRNIWKLIWRPIVYIFWYNPSLVALSAHCGCQESSLALAWCHKTKSRWLFSSSQTVLVSKSAFL